MQRKRGMKLSVLVIMGLLLLGLAVPVMAGTTGTDLSNKATKALNNVRCNFHWGMQGKQGGKAYQALSAEEQQKLQANREAKLQEMLSSGKISQADYDARLALEKKMAQYRDEMKDLSPADRQAKMKDLRTQALKELLAAGTITQAQFDRLSQAPGPGGRGEFQKGGHGMGGPGHGRNNDSNNQ